VHNYGTFGRRGVSPTQLCAVRSPNEPKV
jgi:hypothetical protein